MEVGNVKNLWRVTRSPGRVSGKKMFLISGAWTFLPNDSNEMDLKRIQITTMMMPHAARKRYTHLTASVLLKRGRIKNSLHAVLDVVRHTHSASLSVCHLCWARVFVLASHPKKQKHIYSREMRKRAHYRLFALYSITCGLISVICDGAVFLEPRKSEVILQRGFCVFISLN